MAYKGLASWLGKPLQESLPEIVTVENLLQLFHTNGFELTPTSDKIVSYTDAERQPVHVKVPVPPDNIQPTIEINPTILKAVYSGKALIVGVVNDFHSLCLVIIYDTDTTRYMCYSFGVGGHDGQNRFSIYQPDFTLVGLNSFFPDQDQNMMAQNIRKSRIVDIQPFTPELLQKYYELFFNTTNYFSHFTNNLCQLIPKKKKEHTALNCAFALSYFLDIKTSIIGINGTLDQGLGSVAQISMNTGRLYTLIHNFIATRPKKKTQSDADADAAAAASDPDPDPDAVADAAAAAAKPKRLKSNRGGTRRRKTNKRKGRRTMKKRKGRKTKKKR
jgi:hypothetical protein